ncbi:MAG: hypothetical protein A2X42_02590 [Candidatus Margulisbacteria bacterium GWF2_38_17]|nr:MAG: hypothetical protein A2X42_02590 [Candidatus Margulisbacteria bacterium GWF2_38_17]
MKKRNAAILIVAAGIIITSIFFIIKSDIFKVTGISVQAKKQAKIDTLEITNFLKNPDFSADIDNNGIPDNWGEKPYNSKTIKDKKTGKYYLHIKNDEPGSAIGSQKIAIDGRQISLLSVAGYVRASSVTRGNQPWETGKIQVLFFDKNSKQIGDWPEVGSYTGSFDWKQVKKVFQVPRATRIVQLNIGLWNCSGEIDFSHFKVVPNKPLPRDQYNFVINGDFEIWQGWVYGGSADWGIQYPGYNGDGLLFINNESNMWSFATQSIKIDSTKIKNIKISAWMKIKKIVQGEQPWEKARINVEFKNEQGVRLGGWPIVHEAAGNFDWKKVEQAFEVPEGTTKVELFVGLLNCKGEAWFDDIVMNAFGKNGEKIVGEDFVKTNTKNWFTFAPQEIKPGSVLDLSPNLQAPAGKNGFVKVKNDHFYFENGERARFYGTNVFGPQLFLSKNEASVLADRIARLGFNIVRIHHLDAAWSDPNIFDKTYNDTQHFSKENLDKVDFFISELEKRGVYIYLDLLVHRGFKEGDKVNDHDKIDNGAKVTGVYDGRLIALQKKYAKDLLLHVNPYTQKQYLKDPAIAMVGIVNENSLFYVAQQPWLPESSTNKLNALWQKWLKKKYKTHDDLDIEWSDSHGAPLLESDEKLNKGTVRRGKTMLAKYRPTEAKNDLREKDTLQFYYELEKKYFAEMFKYLRSIGLKSPVAGSNHWENIEFDIKANAGLDFIDRHRYWNHPQFGYGTGVVFDNLSMIKYPEKSIPAILAAQKVKGKPFVVSEWNTAWPGDYYFEGPAIMASYAKLQDWDALLQFSFNSPRYPEVFSDNFDVASFPNVVSQLQVAGEAFYSTGITPAKVTVCEYVSDDALKDLIKEDRGVFDKPELSLVTAVSKSFDKAPNNYDPSLNLVNTYIGKKGSVLKSTTGQMEWNSKKGIITLNSQKIIGAIGYLKSIPIEIANINFTVDTDFASLFFVSKDGKPLAESKKILVVATARAENTGMIYNTVKTQIIDIGDAPILLEGVKASINIKNSSAGIHVYSVGFDGKTKQEITTKNKNSAINFELLPSNQTLYYLITR